MKTDVKSAALPLLLYEAAALGIYLSAAEYLHLLRSGGVDVACGALRGAFTAPALLLGEQNSD